MKNDIKLNSIDFAALPKTLSHFLHRYHVVIFTLIVLGGLAIATFTLYSSIMSASAPSPAVEATGFDTKTIDEINKLRDVNDAAQPLNKPAGRTNPFE